MSEEGLVEDIKLESVSISPNNCPMDEALDMAMEFTTFRALPAARWEVKVHRDSLIEPTHGLGRMIGRSGARLRGLRSHR